MTSTETAQEPERPSLPRGVAVAVVAVFALAVTVTVVQPLLSRRDARASDFVAALQKHAAIVQPGDRVLVQPPWRDDVVTAITGAVALPRGVVVSEAFAPRHGDPWPALVVVRDTRHALPDVIEDRAASVVRGEVFEDDGIEVFRIGNGSAAAAAVGNGAVDAAGSPFNIAAAHVFVDDASSVVECPFDAAKNRHVCAGLPEWMTVGEDTLQIGGKRERCIWSHPRTGATLVVDFGAVEFVGSVITASVALTDGAADNDTGAAVKASLVVDDEAHDVIVHHERGFHDVSATVEKGPHTVRLRFTTDNDGQRHTCFRLTAVPR